MNKNDLRYIKTDKLIIDVFMNCVDEVGFDKTTVAMICSKGLISRNTFYLHYDDKFDLLKSMCTELENKIMTQINNELLIDLKAPQLSHQSKWLLNIITANKKTIKTLFKCARTDLQSIIEHVFIDIPSAKFIDNYYEKLKDKNRNYNKIFVLSSMMGLIEIIVNSETTLDSEDLSYFIESLSNIHDKLFTERLIH